MATSTHEREKPKQTDNLLESLSLLVKENVPGYNLKKGINIRTETATHQIPSKETLIEQITTLLKQGTIKTGILLLTIGQKDDVEVISFDSGKIKQRFSQLQIPTIIEMRPAIIVEEPTTNTIPPSVKEVSATDPLAKIHVRCLSRTSAACFWNFTLQRNK